MNIKNFKYNVGDVVMCISITPENYEGLELGKVYTVSGMSYHDGLQLYAVMDEEGILKYSMDRFRRLGKQDSNTSVIVMIKESKAKKEKEEINAKLVETIDRVKAQLTSSSTADDIKKVQFQLDEIVMLMDESNDDPTTRLLTKKQNGYIAGLAKKLGYSHRELPAFISTTPDCHEISEYEASQVIDRMLAIVGFMEDSAIK